MTITKSWVFSFCLMVISSAAYAQSDVRGSRDHPLVTRFPGTHISDFVEKNYEEFFIAVGPMARGSENAEGRQNLPLIEAGEGQVTSITYVANSVETTALEVFRNFVRAFGNSGFERKFTCSGDKQCGPRFVPQLYWYGDTKRQGRHRRLSAPNTFSPRYIYHYYSGSVQAEDAFYIVSLLVSQDAAGKLPVVTILDINEPADLDDGQVSVSLEGMRDALDREGKFVLDGVFFDFDMDTLTPESQDTLVTLANYLRSKPDETFFVVGHTDSQGGFDYNIDLSKRRAASVVRSLASQHRVDGDRLFPVGIGPVSPRASNGSEDGREQNRRVELVLRD